MVHCSSCGKPIDRIPTWMGSIKTEFVCNNCPNRTMKNIAFVSLETTPKAPAEDEGLGDLPEDDED